MKNPDKFQLDKVLSISFAHFFHDVFSSFLAPVLPLLIAKFNLSYTLAGLLSVFQRIPSLLNPFIGLIADRTGVRYLVIFAPLVTAVAMSLIGVAPHYSLLAIFLGVAGISSAVFHVPAPVMIKRLVADRVGKGMSYYMLGGELARTLGPLTILAAVSFWQLEGTWRLIPFAMGASLLLYLKLRRIDRATPHRNKQPTVQAKQVLLKLIPFFALVSCILISRAGMKSALTVFLPTYMSSKGASLWVAGISLSVIQFSGALGTFVAGSLSDLIGRKAALLIIAAATPVFMWLFIVLDGILTIPLLIVIGFFLFASGPVLLALVQDIDSEHQAFVNGIYMTINFGINSLAVILIGFTGDSIGLEITYQLACIGALFAIPLVLLLKESRFHRGAELRS